MRTNTRRHPTDDESGTGTTAMIDIVFLLLVFFIVTLTATDIEAILKAPPARKSRIIDPPPQIVISICVGGDGYETNGQAMDLAEMESKLKSLTEFSTEYAVAISSTPDASHQRLVSVLDLCSKLEFDNVAITSR